MKSVPLLILAVLLASCERSEQQCQPPYFSCGRGDKCIPDYAVCDGRSDCKNNADESNCTSPGGPCAQGYIQCREGNCIEDYKRCNGYVDCEETSSDEENCAIDTTSPTITTTTLPSVRGCNSKQFDCGDHCISIGFRCDTFLDCLDGSDEEGCGNCRDSEFQCSDLSCIPKSLQCDGNSDCPDNGDETDCPEPPRPARCNSKQYQCNDGSCIDDFRQCDGTPDCPDSSDESDCSICPSNQFQCTNNFDCIPINLRCNGKNDCNDGSDEYNCPTERPTSPPDTTPRGINCPYGMQPCKSGDNCAKYCDGRVECYDMSDETDCSFNPQELDLRTYPNGTEERELSQPSRESNEQLFGIFIREKKNRVQADPRNQIAAKAEMDISSCCRGKNGYVKLTDYIRLEGPLKTMYEKGNSP